MHLKVSTATTSLLSVAVFLPFIEGKRVKDEVRSLIEGGALPKFIIIDDEWKAVGMDPPKSQAKIAETANFANKLISLKENLNFHENGAANGLHGRYIYYICYTYGFVTGEIAQLRIAGFGSFMVSRSVVGSLADREGRRRACVTYCITYTLSCITNRSPKYKIMMAGCIFGGIATSLLFSSLESWLVAEQLKRDFEQKWPSVTFSKALFRGNGLVAIVAGVFGNLLVSDSFNLRLVSPCETAATFRAIAAIFRAIGRALILSSWIGSDGDPSESKDLLTPFKGYWGTTQRCFAFDPGGDTSQRFYAKSELVAELVTVHGFNVVYAIRDGVGGLQGGKSEWLPWLPPTKAVVKDSIGNISKALLLVHNVTLAAAAGLGNLAYTLVDTIRRVLALVPLVSTKLLFEGDRKRTIRQIEEVFNVKVGKRDLIVVVQKFGFSPQANNTPPDVPILLCYYLTIVNAVYSSQPLVPMLFISSWFPP